MLFTASSTHIVQWHVSNKYDTVFQLYNKAKTTDNNRRPIQNGVGASISRSCLHADFHPNVIGFRQPMTPECDVVTQLPVASAAYANVVLGQVEVGRERSPQPDLEAKNTDVDVHQISCRDPDQQT